MHYFTFQDIRGAGFTGKNPAKPALYISQLLAIAAW